MTAITLRVRGGYFALVDQAFHPFLSRWQWSLNNSGYVTSGLGMLHHLCYGPRARNDRLGDICHLNENKLDCRRENLAHMPHWLNQVLNPKRAGALKGVTQLPSGNWKAELTIAGSKVYLGCAASRTAAADIKLGAIHQARDLYLQGRTPAEIRDALAAR